MKKKDEGKLRKTEQVKRRGQGLVFAWYVRRVGICGSFPRKKVS